MPGVAAMLVVFVMVLVLMLLMMRVTTVLAVMPVHPVLGMVTLDVTTVLAVLAMVFLYSSAALGMAEPRACLLPLLEYIGVAAGLHDAAALGLVVGMSRVMMPVCPASHSQRPPLVRELRQPEYRDLVLRRSEQIVRQGNGDCDHNTDRSVGSRGQRRSKGGTASR